MAKENSPSLILKSNKLERMKSHIPKFLNYNYNNITTTIIKNFISFDFDLKKIDQDIYSN